MAKLQYHLLRDRMMKDADYHARSPTGPLKERSRQTPRQYFSFFELMINHISGVHSEENPHPLPMGHGSADGSTLTSPLHGTYQSPMGSKQ